MSPMRGAFRFPVFWADRPRFDGAKPEQHGGEEPLPTHLVVDAARHIVHFAGCGVVARWQQTLTSSLAMGKMSNEEI